MLSDSRTAAYPRLVEDTETLVPNSYTFHLSATSSFGVYRASPAAWRVVIPGEGTFYCWNIDQIEKRCREFVEHKLALDEQDEDPVYDAAARADDEYQLRMEGAWE